MKLLFNKSIFKDRSFIKMVCFTIVLLLVLVLGNCFGFVHAEGSAEDLFLNLEYYESSNVYNSYYYNINYIHSSDNSINGSNALYSLDYSNISNVPSDFSFDDINYYCVIGSGYPSRWRVYLFHCDKVPIIHCGENNSANYYLDNLDSSDVYYMDVISYGNGTDLTSPYATLPTGITSVSASYDSEAGCYYLLTDNTNAKYILGANFPYVTYNTQANFTNGSYHGDLVAYFQGASLDSLNLHDVNYMNVNGTCPSLNGFNNLENVSGGAITNPETSSNNMYLDSCKFTFNFNKYVKTITDDDLSYKGNWNKGNVVFDAILNDYQVEHLNEFTLHIQWQVLIAGKGFYLLDNPLGGYDLGTAVPFGGNYVMSIESTYPLSTFHSSGDSLSWNADTIYSSIYCDNSLLVDYNHSLTSLLAQASEFYEIDWSSFKLYANAWLSTSTEESDKRIDSYNYLTEVSTNVSDSLNHNNNPYIDGEDSSFFDSDDSTTTSHSSSSGYGNVNQNVTVNVDNSSSFNNTDSTISGLIDKLLGTDDEDFSSAGLTDDFTEATNSNGWLELMSATFGFVPLGVWNKLSATLVTVLGIMVVAFILRIILDLL